MSDEQTSGGEVVRVLLLHASFKASQGIQDPNAEWWWECDGCEAKVSQGGTGRQDVFFGLAKHQAEELGKAGLLRDDPQDAQNRAQDGRSRVAAGGGGSEGAEGDPRAADWCSQCGKPYAERACGPTHAVIAAGKELGT